MGLDIFRNYRKYGKLIKVVNSLPRSNCALQVLERVYSTNEEKNVRNKNVKELLDDSATFSDAIPKSPDDVWATSPYPVGAHPRDQSLHSFRPRVDPKETSVILFPGQGTQYIGMSKRLLLFPNVKDLFEAANEILQYDLLKICLEGPREKLNRTEYSQPAILVSSLASLEKLKEEKPSAIENCVATAGFSLGELTALVFAEAISFERAIRLVKVRAEAMQLASEITPGSMISVLYGPDSNLSQACVRAKEYAEQQGVVNPYCGVSNYLFPHSKIVAGSEEAIKFLEENKDEFKLRKLKRLTVCGAFHTPHMVPAMEVFREALKKAKISDPTIAVHSNIDGKHYKNAEHIRKQLPRQIIAPVKWEQTMHIIYERPKNVPFPMTFECGPGKGLSLILKMINAKACDSCRTVGA